MLSLCSQCCATSNAALSPMLSSPGNEKAIAIAITLLKQQNPKIVQRLKALLTFIPNPNHVKAVLTTAVIRLVNTSPESALWLFHHSDVLAPEIQVREIIAQELTRKLLCWGYSLNDFRFTADRYLEMGEGSQQSLCSDQATWIDEPVLTLICTLLLP